MPGYFWLMMASDAALIVLAVGCFVIIFRQKVVASRLVHMLDDAINSSINGLVLFDHRQVYRLHNRHAEKFLPVLADETLRPHTVPQLLAYMQDNGVDLDATTRRVLERSPSRQDLAQGFSEVIGWGGDRMCLVQVQRTAGKGTMVLIIDISQSRSQEAELMHLSQENRELVAAIESIRSGVIITDLRQPNRPIVFANRFFANLLGVPRQEIIGTDWRFVMDGLGSYESVSRIEQALEQEVAAEIEFSPSREKGKAFYSLQLSPVLHREGRAQLCVGILTDVTSVKVREARTFQAQRLEALGQLAGGVAHDFNNVLSIIDGYSRLSEAACGGCHGTGEYLGRIRAAVQRGASLTRRLLAFGRHGGHAEGAVDIGLLIQDQLSLLRPLVEQDITIEFQAPREPVFVSCAPDAIGNILMNLMVNSKDAMPDGGRIFVRIEIPGDECLPGSLRERFPEPGFIRLSVADTGEGIPKDLMGKIFDPFFTTKAVGKGTGLGLSMVYGLVAEIGGQIEVASEIGQGTEVSIFLPLAEAPQQKVLAGDAANPFSLRFDGFTALIAEDEPDLLMLVSSLLEERGMNVLRAPDGSQALVVQDEFQGGIDLLLTDVVMPGLNGIRLHELVASLRPEVETIFMSGYPSGGEMARYALPEGARLVTKPVDQGALLTMIHDVFTRRAGAPESMEVMV